MNFQLRKMHSNDNCAVDYSAELLSATLTFACHIND